MIFTGAQFTNPGSKKGVPNQRCKRSNVQDVEPKRFRGQLEGIHCAAALGFQPSCSKRRARSRCAAAGGSQFGVHVQPGAAKCTGPSALVRSVSCCGCSFKSYMRNTPKRLSLRGRLSAAARLSPSTMRVSCAMRGYGSKLQAVRRGTKQQRVAKPTRPSWLAGLNNSQHVSSCSGETRIKTRPRTPAAE